MVRHERRGTTAPRAPVWTGAITLLGVTFLTRAAENVAQVSYPLLGHERLHLSPAAIGVTVGASGALYTGAAMLLAARAHGPRVIASLLSGLAAYTAGYVLFALSPDVYVFFAAAIALGLGGGLAVPSLMTLAGRTGPGGPERSVTRFTVALSLSLLVGPLVEAVVLAVSGDSLRSAFWVFSPWPLVAAAAILASSRRWRRELAGDGHGGSGRRHDPPAHVQRAAFRLAAASGLMYEISFAAVVAFGGLAGIAVHHLSVGTVALLFAAFYGVSLLIRSTIAWHAPIENKHLLVRICAAVTMAGMACLVVHGTAFFVVGMLLLGSGHGLSHPVNLALIAEGTAPSGLVVANARFSGTLKIADIIVPAALGAGVHAIGYQAAFLLLEAPILALAIPACLARRSH
ncbi:MAG: hypothetical protein M0020_06045 [Actinomycetota bacterium]|nr:hypothetical protein [Actinomycetota bacterium]